MRLTRVVAFVLLPALLPSLTAAQSLGDAARKEKERRKRLEESGVKPRELSDKDLRSGRPASADDPAKEKETETTAEAGAKPSSVSSADAEAEAREKAEADWRRRVARARARAESARKAYEYLNSQSMVTGDTFVDEHGKPVITSVEQLRTAIAKAKSEWDVAEKALENLLESARRENVPPGWLR